MQSYRYFIKNQHPIAHQIVEIISRSNFSYTLLWIPGHSNLLGNDLADKSAKEAALMTPINQEQITTQDLNIRLRQKFLSSWQQIWTQTSLTNKLGSFKNHPQKWFTNVPLTRKTEIALRRLRLGHTNFTCGYLLKEETKPTCPSCQMPLSIQHLLQDCPKFAPQHTQSALPNNLIEIFDTSTTNVNALSPFLHLTNIAEQI